MTIAALESTIAHLIMERRAAHGNEAWQDMINEKLTRLYDLKRRLMQKAQKQAV